MSKSISTETWAKTTEPVTSEPNGAVLTPPMLSPEEWAAHVARVKEARGKFAHVFSSIEEFNQRKQEEIDREDEQSQERIKGEGG